MANDHCALVFVKTPVKGMVKSRLGAYVGDEMALELYLCFVKDTLEMLKRGGHPFNVCFHPPDSRDRVARWIGDTHKLLPQRGDDLGERMKNAFLETFSQGFRSVVIIGSDSPDLPDRLIDEAFASLQDHGAVIGPSLDGGYYLIGFRTDTFLPEVFDGIPWSTPEVFSHTVTILQKEARLVHILQEWRDIDTIEDLRAFYANNRDAAFAQSSTIRYIKDNPCVLL